MKTSIRFFIIILVFASNVLGAEDVTTVTAKSTDISDNLDLEVIASVFGEAKNLEDFEKRLNDPEVKISNLDLNEDGEVDYLRVIETSQNDTYVVTIQAVIGKDQYQDVATIDVEKNSKGETQVQVVGDVYMYGPDYIIEPVYVYQPSIFFWFWGAYYRPWYSPYYWRYYPPYYHPWRPYPVPYYRQHVSVHINVKNSYNYTSVRNSKTAVQLQNKTRRNDYGAKNDDQSFVNRHEGVKNRHELNQKIGNAKINNPKVNDLKQSTGRPVQNDWKPATERGGKDSRVRDNRVSVPSQRPSTGSRHHWPSQPINRPSNPRPTARPATRPAPKSRPHR